MCNGLTTVFAHSFRLQMRIEATSFLCCCLAQGFGQQLNKNVIGSMNPGTTWKHAIPSFLASPKRPVGCHELFNTISAWQNVSCRKCSSTTSRLARSCQQLCVAFPPLTVRSPTVVRCRAKEFSQTGAGHPYHHC